MSEYIELNMNNFNEDDVSQLNEWAIAAFRAISDITGEAAFDGLPESKQEELLRLGELWCDKIFFPRKSYKGSQTAPAVEMTVAEICEALGKKVKVIK
jgi:hypothetical protein